MRCRRARSQPPPLLRPAKPSATYKALLPPRVSPKPRLLLLTVHHQPSRLSSCPRTEEERDKCGEDQNRIVRLGSTAANSTYDSRYSFSSLFATFSFSISVSSSLTLFLSEKCEKKVCTIDRGDLENPIHGLRHLPASFLSTLER